MRLAIKVGLATIATLASLPALAQLGYPFNGQATNAATSYPQPANLLTSPNAQISVCNYPAQSGPTGACINTVPIFTDPSLAQALPNPFKADITGAYGFSTSTPGVYVVSIVNQQGVFQKNLIVPVGGGSGGGGGTAGVTTFNGRNGTVTPQLGDYSFSLLGGSIGLPQLPTIPAAQTSGFAPVATSGAYTDLTGRPTLGAAAGHGASTTINGQTCTLDGTCTIPTGSSVQPATSTSQGTVQLGPGQTSSILAPVATSGAYNDLSGKPAATAVPVPGLVADGTTDDSAALTSACTPGKELYLPAGKAIALASSVTLGCYLHSNGSQLQPASTTTLTINGRFDAPLSRAFAGAGAVVFGPNTSRVPVEWFGAVGDFNYSTKTGTDNTAAMQAALNSLTAGQILLQAKTYMTTAALTITKSAVGVAGTSQGYVFTTLLPISVIMQSSPTADILDLTGSASNYIAWNALTDFSVQRSTIASGGANGIAMNFVGGAKVFNVQSQDSVSDWYLHATPNYGVGSFTNVNAGWGYSIAGTYPNGFVGYGFYLDSSDGNAENTIVLNNAGVGNGGGSNWTSYGVYVTGKAINDVDIYELNDAGTTYGVYAHYTGTGNYFGAGDLHLILPTIDTFSGVGVHVDGLTAASSGQFNIHGGWIVSSIPTASHALEVVNSTGVSMTGVNAYSTGSTAVYASGSSNLQINDNFLSRSAGMIQLASTKNSTFTGNVLRAESGYTTGTMIALAGSTNNVIADNALGGPATTGISFDTASTGNTGVGSNNIDSSTIATPISDTTYTYTAPALSAGCAIPGSPNIYPVAAVDNGAGGSGATVTFDNGDPSGAHPFTSPNNCNFAVTITTGASTGSAGGPAIIAFYADGKGNNTPAPARQQCTITPLDAQTAKLQPYSDGNNSFLLIGTALPYAPNTQYSYLASCRLR